MQNALREIPLGMANDNPYNPRIDYKSSEILSLRDTIAKNGLVSPVKVREKEGKYQLVYGHRRLRVAKLLGWSTIRAEAD
jgi:ParB family transcriptional regulator, chromosome partitioning protein